MELAFASRELRAICESEADAQRELTPRTAEVLKHRLADVRAATSIQDVLVGRPRLLNGTDDHHMVVDLDDAYVMVFCANHVTNPVADDGTLDWRRVSRIKILRIEKDHG